MLFNRRSPRPTHFRPISLRRSGVGMGTVSNQERQTPGDQGRRRRWAGPLWIPGPERPSSCWYQLTITNLTYSRCHYKAIIEIILTFLEGLTSPIFAQHPIFTLPGLRGMWLVVGDGRRVGRVTAADASTPLPSPHRIALPPSVRFWYLTAPQLVHRHIRARISLA